MEQVIQSFEKAWQNFETVFKGKLLAYAGAHEVTESAANLLLKETSLDWFTGYGLQGKWLRDYKQQFPDRAGTIAAILNSELRVSQAQETEQKQQSQSATSNKKYVLPVAGAVVGLVVASAFRAPALVRVAAAAIPAVLLYPKSTGGSKASSGRANKAVIDGYVAQLQPHKRRILAEIQQ